MSAAVGLGRVVPSMGANFGDIDNDGFLDFYLGTGAPSFASLIPNILLQNDAGRRFVDVTDATGTGHLQKGHGVAFADLDRDGDEDIVLNAGGAVPGDSYDDALFENPGARRPTLGRRCGWSASRSNRAAIGAKIRVTVAAVAGGRGRRRLRYREVSSGGSFGSNSYVQHVGLGARHRHRVDRDRLAGQQDQAGVPQPADRHAARDPGGRRGASGPTTGGVPSWGRRRRAPAHQH